MTSSISRAAARPANGPTDGLTVRLTARRTPRVAAPIALAAGALLAACGTTEAPGPLQPGGPLGRLRLVNLITDTTRGRVNAILEGVPFGVNLTYGLSTPATLPAPSTALYAPVLARSRTLVLRRTADTTALVATFPLTIGGNEDRTVYATGGAAGTPVAAFATVDTNVAAAAGQARVRVVHLSPTAGAVDVFVTAPNADLAAATPTLANVPVRGVSGYLSVAPGTYQVRAVPAGTPAAGRTAAVALTASVTLAAGNARTLVAADNNVGGAPLRVVVLTDQ